MLKDLPANWESPSDSWFRMLRRITEGVSDPQVTPLRVYRGIYVSHLNFDHEIENMIAESYPDFSSWNWAASHSPDEFYSYGVVDHWTQLPLEFLEQDERSLLVTLTRHVRADQPAAGGWRWHKWGPYYGVFQEQVAQTEYLYDTPDVTEVYSFHVFELHAEVAGGD